LAIATAHALSPQFAIVRSADLKNICKKRRETNIRNFDAASDVELQKVNHLKREARAA
jgi:hypothetical protein